MAAAEQSGMDWGEIQTRQDSLDDVFVKLVSGQVNEQGEITSEESESKPAVGSGGAKEWLVQKESFQTSKFSAEDT